MGVEPSYGDLIAEIKSARLGDVEASVNEIYKRLNRPGFDNGYSVDEIDERKDVSEWLCTKHALATPMNDGLSPAYEPSSDEIAEGLIARKAIRALWRHGQPAPPRPDDSEITQRLQLRPE
jgi:hypothetical protein